MGQAAGTTPDAKKDILQYILGGSRISYNARDHAKQGSRIHIVQPLDSYFLPIPQREHQFLF